MNKYNHQKIEKKWQKYWDAKKIFKTNDKAKGPKKYILDMFPYPSGAGLHVGHPEGYTATDIVSRYSRMNGFNVLHPMGWDAFGLPAENYAIKMGVHPQKTTQKNIKRFTQQIKSIGLSYDWSRELNTSDPEYYKWTQWLFLQFYKKGLAYKKLAAVNWCPKDNTVLANEQVIDGKCERCGTEVIQKKLSQWFFKITAYADELLSEIDKLDWPEPIKLMQRNWIGKSQGAEIEFRVNQPKVKRFVLLHGRASSASQNFLPWLKLELEKRGFEVESKDLPNPKTPDDVAQTEFALKNFKFDDSTVVIGHSFGGVVGLRLLEKGVKMNRLVLVSTPFSGNYSDNKERPTVTAALKKGFDFETIKKNSLGFTCLYDLSDEVVPMSDGESFAEKLGVGVIKTTGTKHHFGADVEPEVLNVALGAIKVFTTRPDTIFGATYLVLAPEHPLVNAMAPHLSNKDEIYKYVEETKKKSELQRTQLEKEKTGVELKGVKVVNPVSGEEIPLWIADYVIINYGTGSIMGVPAHCTRDFEFVQKFNLPVKRTIENVELGSEEYSDQDKVINSDFLNGLTVDEAIEKSIQWFESKAIGKRKLNYKLRDWLVSRQRYWGAPIPIIYCKTCGEQPVPEKDLPVKLPTDADFRPTGESPLKRSKKFSKVTCPKCKEKAERDYDTMDTFVDSSWYFLRYADNKNKKVFADKKKMQTWAPVNMYVGGAEHAVLHLLYARFFTKVLRDLGYLNFGEPFLALKNQGLILGPDGEKMSKSRGNVINPDDVIKESGADSLRMYEMFMGPFEDAKPWQTNGIIGVKRFLERVWNWVSEKQTANSKQQTVSDKANRELHKLIKKVTEDIEGFHFNTSVSAFMQFHNDIKDEPVSKEFVKTFLTLLNPFAPHITEELNQLISKSVSQRVSKSLQFEKWPKFDPALVIDSEIEVIVQVNGKVKGKITIARGSSEEVVKSVAMQIDAVKQSIGTQEIKRIINVPNRLINFVV